MISDDRYFERRELEERNAASRASSRDAREKHLKLAACYAELKERLALASADEAIDA